MNDTRRRHPVAIALYVNAALLALIAVILLSRSSSPGLMPAAFAQQQPVIGGGAGLFAIPGQLSDRTYGCYVMDVDSQVLCAYQYFPSEKELRLVAARQFRYDRKLVKYNTNPSPQDIKKIVEEQAKAQEGDAPPAPNP